MSDPRRVEEIFLAALEKSPGTECAHYLADACGADTELRGAVERLLDAHAHAGAFLEHGPTELLAPVDPSDEMPTGSRHDGTPDLVGVRIGPYKLLEEIGEGGMGVVYMADQEQPLRRRVALKVIKPGLNSRQVVARFEAERQALALMDHLNIARVLDAGTTESGRPYFVMELVRGVPITEFCDQNKLPVHERLELFEQVCQAVQHAHQKGIIHRDIKPSNVLVTLNDDRAVPKVIDFGVAKAVNQQLTDKTLFTQFAQMIGTPLYMSPEQAQMTSLDVDTRTDVYALGVLLYELLTGTTPFDRHRLGTAAHDEVRRIIREEVPPRPSLRISTLGQQRTVVAAHRQAQPERLCHLVRGDLDWIVMKALEKDRSRRYATALGFAADVRRYLTHEPVEAGPPSAVYRLRKFARRYRAALATVGTIFAVLLLGIVASTWQAIRATHAEAQAETARAAAAAQEIKERDAKLVAETERQKADEQREIAEARQSQVEKLAYPVQITRAKQLWDRGEVAEAKASLNATAENLRGWEYHYLRSLFKNPVVLRGHGGRVDRIAYSADGRTIASYSFADGITFWDVGSLRELRTFKGHAVLLDFSPDLRKIARYSHNPKGVELVDVESGAVLCRLPEIDDPHFIQRGEQLVGQVTTNRLDWLLPFLIHGVIPQGDIQDRELGVWEVGSGLQTRNIRLPSGQRFLAMSADGRRYATADGEIVHVWETETGHKVSLITLPPKSVPSAQFSGNGSRLAVFSYPNASIYDAKSAEPIFSIRAYSSKSEFSADGRRLLIGGSLWDVDAECELFSWWSDPTLDFAIPKTSPTGDRIVAGLENGNLMLWSVTQRPDVYAPKRINGEPVEVTIAFSHDGDQLVGGSETGEVLIWSTRERSEPRIIDTHTDEIRRVAFSADGHKVVSESRERIDVTDIITEQVISRVSLPQSAEGDDFFHDPIATGIAIDGSLVAREVIGTEEIPGAVEVWDPMCGKCIATLQRHFDSEEARKWQTESRNSRLTSKIAFSPDNRQLAVGYEDGRACVWNLESGHEVFVLAADAELSGPPILDVTFSNDGTKIATAGKRGSIIIWEAATGKQSSRLVGHNEDVCRVTYSPDDQRIVSWSDDSTVRIWNVELGVELLRFGYAGPSSDYGVIFGNPTIAFSPDGGILAISSYSPIYLLNGRPIDPESDTTRTRKAQSGD